MQKCFCIQPFDGGSFDKRFDDVFQPAIEKAGLDPYRIDRDPSVIIPIEDIEKGIKTSELCFAEITSDNPNVWFELGFAIAIGKDIILVCSNDRDKFPFDIQHRSIIRYKTESTSDFLNLQDRITDRIVAILKKDKELKISKEISPIANTSGLSPHEMVALVAIMQNSFADEDGVPIYTIKNDMNNAGYTDIAVSLAIKLLNHKGFISSKQREDWNGNIYFVYNVESLGVEWLMQNQEKLILQKESEEKIKFSEDSDDDLPF